MKTFYVNISLGLCLMILIACDRPEDIPAYLHITEFDLVTTKEQGSDSHKITDAFVYINGKSIGAYEVPSTIPVIAEGPTEVIIFPGIKDNGVRAISAIYPMYERFDASIDFRPAEEDTVRPVVRYKDQIEFMIIENFDVTHFFTKDYDENEGTNIELTRTENFEGQASGIAILTKDSSELEVAWHEPFITPESGEYYFEMDYKTNIPFIIGVKGFFAGIPTNYYDGIVNPKEEWNKIYFNFTSLLNSGGVDVFEVVIVGLWAEAFEVEEAKILIDNVKLVRQQ